MNAKELCGVVANAKLDTFVTWTALDRSNLSDGRKLAVNYYREGSTWSGYFTAQNHPSFQSAMVWRWFFGLMTFVGLILLIWDLLTIGKGETRKMAVVEAE